MGWSTLDVKQDHPLLRGVDESFRFYFVHSYHLRCADPGSVLATTRYGIEFDSAVRRGDNVVGVQFHPEKSHRFGMQVLRNFAELP
jgi:glutamine amidotransferase